MTPSTDIRSPHLKDALRGYPPIRPRPTAAPSKGGCMSTIKHSQISALLVDDDAKLCGLLRDYLEGFGFSLDVAEDASSGLEKAVANEYDVILLDMMLPDMDGLDVLRRLREINIKSSRPSSVMSWVRETQAYLKSFHFFCTTIRQVSGARRL